MKIFKLNKQRKKIKPNSVAENRFFTLTMNYFKNSLKGVNFNSIDEVIAKLESISYKKLAKEARIFGYDILRKNRDGFIGILSSMSNRMVSPKRKTSESRENQEKLFTKALPSLIKEKQIYSPYLDKFEENISLIKNIPKEISESLKAAYLRGEGLRGTNLENLITEKLGNRAKIIIRTESSKINTALTEVRAKSFGINCYIWSTSQDVAVRPSHKLMNNVLVFWNDKPSLDKMTGHAGEYPYCRCVPLAIFSINDIQFPVKVAERLIVINEYNKNTKQNTAKIIGGRIKTYTKTEFISVYGTF